MPDALQDARFANNSLVTGPPHIRFYASVPLVTPKKHKLGTFCIIDNKPRPEGLTLAEKQNLRELTDMVMDTLIHRKSEMERLMDEKARMIAVSEPRWKLCQKRSLSSLWYWQSVELLRQLAVV